MVINEIHERFVHLKGLESFVECEKPKKHPNILILKKEECLNPFQLVRALIGIID